jgi:hypothetical protein
MFSLGHNSDEPDGDYGRKSTVSCYSSDTSDCCEFSNSSDMVISAVPEYTAVSVEMVGTLAMAVMVVLPSVSINSRNNINFDQKKLFLSVQNF